MGATLKSSRGLPPLAVAAALTVWLAPSAHAAGVTFDPGSPAGKQYAIPLDQARANASPGDKVKPGRRPSPFGNGIEAAKSPPPRSVVPPPAAKPRPARPPRVRSGPGVRRTPTTVRAKRVAATNPEGATRGLGLIGLMVLGFGLAGGLLARALRRS